MAESSPPPKRKRGRPPIYVLGHDGKPIVGMSLHKADGRYLVTGSKPPYYLGTNFDEALVEFREYQARQRKEFESVPAERPTGAFKGKDFEKGTPDIYVDVPTETYTASVLSADFWSKVGWAIRKNPHLAAERTGLPLDRLHQFKRPEHSALLTDIGKAYFNRPDPMSYQYRHDTKRHWDEFVDVVGNTKVVADVVAEDVRRYKTKIHTDKVAGKRSVHYIRARFIAVRTILRHALVEGLDSERVARLHLDCQMLKPPKTEGLDPNPIEVADYETLLGGADTRMRAILLLSLNCAFYPSEVAAVRKKTLDFDRKTFVDKRMKTKVIRVAVLWDRTIKAVKAFMQESPNKSTWLFLNEAGSRCRARNIANAYRNLRTDVNLPDTVWFAHIRDGAYTAAIEGGADALQAEILAGHRTGIKDAYLKRKPEMVANACKAVHKYYFRRGK